MTDELSREDVAGITVLNACHDTMASTKPQSRAYRDAKRTLDAALNTAPAPQVAAFFQHALDHAGDRPLPLHVTRRFFKQAKQQPLASTPAILDKVVQDAVRTPDAKASVTAYIVGQALRLTDEPGQTVALFGQALNSPVPPVLDLKTLVRVGRHLTTQLAAGPVAQTPGQPDAAAHDVRVQGRILAVLTERLAQERQQQDALYTTLNPRNHILQKKSESLRDLPDIVERAETRLAYNTAMYEAFNDRPDLLQPKTEIQHNIAYLVKTMRGGPWLSGGDHGAQFGHNLYQDGHLGRAANRVSAAIRRLKPDEITTHRDRVISLAQDVSRVHLHNRNRIYGSATGLVDGIKATQQLDQTLRQHGLAAEHDSPVTDRYVSEGVASPYQNNLKTNDPQFFDKQVALYQKAIDGGHAGAGYLALNLVGAKTSPHQKSKVFALVKQAVAVDPGRFERAAIPDNGYHLLREQRDTFAALYNNEVKTDAANAMSLPRKAILAIRDVARQQRLSDVASTLSRHKHKLNDRVTLFGKAGRVLVTGAQIALEAPVLTFFKEARHQILGLAGQMGYSQTPTFDPALNR